MPDTSLAFRPVHDLSTELVAGRLSPVDLVEAHLARIDAREPKLQAFVEVYAEDARLAAQAAELAIRSGHSLGPLHGVPVALKDLIELAGRRVSGGCSLWRERIAQRTATVARRLIGQGMIVLGKTHTVEFAMGGWGTNMRMGTPWNPWDPERQRTPGGSSSGSGVAVAAGLASWAIGTDTGGSVRLPASWCGITGLKTTVGRVSIDGILPLAPTLDTPGPMTRDVEDAALLYWAMQGPDPLDPRTSLRAPESPFPTLRRGVRGLRLGRMAERERAFCTAEVLAAYDEALAVLERLGAEIVAVELPHALADLVPLTGRIISAEGYALLRELIDDETLALDEHVRPRLAAGRAITAEAYLNGLREREALKAEFAATFAATDAFLTPTTPTPAVPLDEVDQTGTPAHFTRFVNLLDMCALALPCGFTADGLPLSLQIACPGYAEAAALRIGWAYENATDWHRRRPPE